VHASSAAELPYLIHSGFTALLHDVRRAEIPCQGDPVRVMFGGDTSIHNITRRMMEFSRARFTRELEVTGARQLTTLRLKDVSFGRAPKFVNHEGKGFPQDASFHLSQFQDSAFGDGSEAKYRHIRNFLHANRDREQAGRCLPRPENATVPLLFASLTHLRRTFP
jgi:hypothetical protein